MRFGKKCRKNSISRILASQQVPALRPNQLPSDADLAEMLFYPDEVLTIGSQSEAAAIEGAYAKNGPHHPHGFPMSHGFRVNRIKPVAGGVCCVRATSAHY